ncbi:cytochrome c family protein [Hyphomicrobium sp.]|uniref:c-type cytochrome n=1 Tax=Hyphomicrobium sp. TaxID=82 RepID=UPI002E2EDD6D|nr:cytochrome c family protein [Hyphomicrobium sp.]HEX2843526.1 cytochrome c family protein [Hyphomicrobium sp.]
MRKWTMAAALLAAVPTAASAQDVAAGGAIFKKCAACHQIGANAKNALGPELTCVVGRKVASVEGFQYSEALKHTTWTTWDDEHFLQWIENNKKLVPGTKMIFPAGVKDETDRANLLAYVKSQCAK